MTNHTWGGTHATKIDFPETSQTLHEATRPRIAHNFQRLAKTLFYDFAPGRGFWFEGRYRASDLEYKKEPEHEV